MNRIFKPLTVGALLSVTILLGGVLAATGSPPTMAAPTPTPAGKQPVVLDVASVDPNAASTLELNDQGPHIYLTNYTFDPLLEPTPHSLPPELRLSSYSPGEKGYYLVQFHGPIQPAWKEAIVAAGAQLFDYIPDFAFVVKMDDATQAAVADMDIVRWVGLYQPGYRIAPSLMSTSASVEGVEPADVTVVVFKGEDMAAITGRLQELGAKILDVTETHWKGKIRVQIPRSKIDVVAHLAGVKWIEPTPEWRPFNNETADIIGVRNVWDTHGLHGAGQAVAVCDTGLDQGSTLPGSLHDDFEDGSGNSRVLAIYDWVGGGDGADDVNSGHGTHVAGSVLGNGYRSGSTPSSHTYPSGAYVGMAPEASLIFQAVENNAHPELGLVGLPSDLNDLFIQAYNDGARIHSNSWGADLAGAYTSDSENVDEFVWDHKDFTILFAAGNAGIDGDADGVVDLFSIGSPGTAKNCVTVGASENDRLSGGYNPGGACSTWGGSLDGCWSSDYPANPIRDDRLSDDPNGMAAFSSRGSSLDGRFKPDIVAPGTNIASTKSSATASTGWGPIDSYYTYMGGTSMATPLVAGATTLVREYYTDLEGITPSAALIKATLVNGATDIYPGQYGFGATQEITPTRPNNVEGWGRINIEQTLFPSSPRERVYYDETPGLGTGATAAYFITVTDASEPLNVTLAWSDYPGSPAANGGLVNDLDLSLTDPNATVHYPNHANPGTSSQTLYYDDGDSSTYYTWSSDIRVGVRFTPNAYPATLQKGQFLLIAASYPKTFNYYVYDGDTSGPDSVLTFGSTSLQQAGWHEVDLSGSGVTINSGDFFLVIQLPDSNLGWFYDATAPIDNRSWDYDGSWTLWTVNDYMFRAVVSDPNFTPTNYDRVNNVVGIDIDTPVLGTYTVTVSGYNVPQDPQPYALVASGAISSVVSTAPVVTSITPNTGVNTGTVHISNLAGSYFESGAAVKLTKSGESDINAYNVTVIPTTTITCDFDLTGAATGQWNVVVTNPDSQSGTLVNGFTVNAPGVTPTVSSITPNEGTNMDTIHITDLAGSNFQSGATVKLTKTGESDINATNVNVVSASRITCDFDLRGATPGQWNVVVTNPGNQSGQLTNGFTVEGAVFLPVIDRCWPLVPYVHPISNSNNDGIYTVEWSWVACASSSPSYYQLQADTDPQFGSPDSFTVYDTSFDAYSPTPATYYWRVRAYISGQGYSDWSNVQSTTVTSWRAYVWVDNDTGGGLTVEIVGVARKSFSTGFHYWRSISPGRYTYKAWARCGSGSWTDDFVAGVNVLSFWCGYSTASGKEDILGTHEVHESQAIRDANAMR